MGISWELDENNRILIFYYWEQGEFDGNKMIVMGY
jgi:hypothetical protein